MQVQPTEPLRLECIRLTHVRIPLTEPFAISSGVVTDKDAILVELFAGEPAGLVGLGEASPMAGGFYSHHTPASSWSALTNRLIPRMSEIGDLDPGGQWFAGLADDPFATCGVDIALWDLAARARGEPLWALLGGQRDRDVESGLAVGIYDTTDELLDRIDHYLSADGYRRVKIKVQPGWDVVPLEAVRQRFGNVPLMADANGAYRREHIDHIASWDRFGLIMIEQPLPQDDLEGHAELAARCHTPICLDESADSPAAVEKAIALKSARILNIKLQRLGGLATALRVHDQAAAAGIGCWMGTMPELGVAAHAAVHFATLPNIRYPTDVESSDRWFIADVTEPPVRCRNGRLPVPLGAGLGVELNADVIDRYKVREYVRPLTCRLGMAIPR